MAVKAVYDTNVWISGLLWRGKPYQCLLFARSGVVQVAYCQEILKELREKLSTKFSFSDARIHQVISDIERFGQVVTIEHKLKAVKSDPDDDKFIECALVTGAYSIVSGDRHLLDVGNYQGVKIQTPTQFVESLKSELE